MNCAACGCDLEGRDRCETCGTRAGGGAVALKVLPKPDLPPPRDDASGVRIVRQIKMPTRPGLDLDTDALAERLPAAMRSAEAAIAEGDLVAADGHLDAALGAVLEGPGHDRREGGVRGLLLTILVAWLAVLLVLFLLNWLTSGA